MKKKIYYRFAAYSVGCLLAMAILLLTIGGRYSIRYAHENINSELTIAAQRILTQMGEKLLYKAQYLVEGMANTVSSLMDKGITDREAVKSMLYGLVREHPDITGIGIAFSANGFDSLDYQHRGEPNCDAEGRFLPYYTLGADGVPILDPLYSYVNDDPDSYYFAPMRSLKPHLTDIYKSLILDKEQLMFTISWPVFNHGKFAGVVLADVALTDEEELIQKFDFYGG